MNFRTTQHVVIAPLWANYRDRDRIVAVPARNAQSSRREAAVIVAGRVARRVYGPSGVVRSLRLSGERADGSTTWEGFVGRLRADGMIDGRSITLFVSATRQAVGS